MKNKFNDIVLIFRVAAMVIMSGTGVLLSYDVPYIYKVSKIIISCIVWGIYGYTDGLNERY